MRATISGVEAAVLRAGAQLCWVTDFLNGTAAVVCEGVDRSRATEAIRHVAPIGVAFVTYGSRKDLLDHLKARIDATQARVIAKLPQFSPAG